MTQKLRIWVDYNGVLLDETVETSLSLSDDLPRRPQLQELVETYDDNGYRCQGTVINVDGPMIRIRLDMSTWGSST